MDGTLCIYVISSYTFWHAIPASLCVLYSRAWYSCTPWLLFTSGLRLIVFYMSDAWFILQPMSSCLSAESKPTTFSTAASVGVTYYVISVVISTITLTVGFLAGVLVYHCISKHQSQSSKPESSSRQQQQATVQQQRAGPEYEEVVELKENVAYGPAQQSIELKACEAYMPVQHWLSPNISLFKINSSMNTLEFLWVA